MFKIFNWGGNRKIDEKTKEKIIETGTKAIENHFDILDGDRSIFTDHEMNDDERTFFIALYKAMKENNFNPALLKLRRMSGGIFSVDYAPLCYVGKINLNPICTPDKYAVIKYTRKKALRVFYTMDEAQVYMEENGGDNIEVRPGRKGETYMQYLRGSTQIKELDNPTLQECIDTIPRWIAYLKYCKRN